MKPTTTTTTCQAKLIRLRAFAFCHGLAFHSSVLSIHLKTRLLGDSYEMLSLVYGLQALALLATESYSAHLSTHVGSWSVVRLCGWARLGALTCLAVAVRDNTSAYFTLMLLCMWALGEGVARALYSGSDIDLIYRLSPDAPTTQHNLSVHHAMWPLAMVVACLFVRGGGEGEDEEKESIPFVWHVGASCVSAALGLWLIWNVQEDGDVSASTSTCIHTLSPCHIARENWRTLRTIWSCPHTRRAWTYAIVFALLTETLNKLRPLWLPAHTSIPAMCLTFLGSCIGSLVSRYPCVVQYQRGARGALICYACAPLLWAAGISWNMNTLIYLACLLVSVAFGIHKSHFYAYLFAAPLPTLTKPALLSTFNLSTQVIHACWMCIVVSPLLDWQPDLLSTFLCMTSLFLVVVLARLQKSWHHGK
jgi:hypothetical protein